VLQDLRYAIRGLVRTPGFTLAVVLTLALGIGANSAIFTLTDALLLRRLPVHDPRRLVQLTMQGGATQPAAAGESFPYPLVESLSAQTEIFSGVFGFSPVALNVGLPGAVERTPGAWVSGEYYETLGLRPIAGRLLTREDDQPGAAPVATITYGYWSTKFGRDPRAIGQTMPIESVAVTIVGVSPQGFTGATVGQVANITLPLAILPQLLPDQANLLSIGNFWLRVLARPNPNVTAAQAQTRLAVVWPHLVSAVPTNRTNIRRMLLATRLEVRSGGTG
jgi:putative ABC transport system permease protein